MKFYKLILCLGLISFAAQAAEEKAPPVLVRCDAESEEFCHDQKNPKDLFKCLAVNAKNLSRECKQELERFIEMRSEAEERGGGSLTSFGGLNAMGPPVPLISYEGQNIPGNKSTSLIENKFGLSIPLYKDKSYTVAGTLTAGELHLGDSLILNTGRSVPTDLYRYEVGGQYMQPLEEKRLFSFKASAGYAGDKPSQAARDASYSLNFSYGVPGSENGYWMYMLFMTNNSPFINYFPIPGVMYIYRTPTFSGMFGFPILSMQWTPVEPWAYSLSLFGTNFQAEISYGHRDQLQGFIGYGVNQQSYIPSDRTTERERLTLQDQRVSAGLRMLLFKTAQLEFQAGQSFNRSIYVGEGFQKKDGGSLALASDSFMSWSLKIGF
ncbi:MAG: hypothetical protein ACXVAX_04145 [Pseudobdellovibrio sp.]